MLASKLLEAYGEKVVANLADNDADEAIKIYNLFLALPALKNSNKEFIIKHLANLILKYFNDQNTKKNFTLETYIECSNFIFKIIDNQKCDADHVMYTLTNLSMIGPDRISISTRASNLIINNYKLFFLKFKNYSNFYPSYNLVLSLALFNSGKFEDAKLSCEKAINYIINNKTKELYDILNKLLCSYIKICIKLDIQKNLNVTLKKVISLKDFDNEEFIQSIYDIFKKFFLDKEFNVCVKYTDFFERSNLINNSIGIIRLESLTRINMFKEAINLGLILKNNKSLPLKLKSHTHLHLAKSYKKLKDFSNYYNEFLNFFLLSGPKHFSNEEYSIISFYYIFTKISFLETKDIRILLKVKDSDYKQLVYLLEYINLKKINSDKIFSKYSKILNLFKKNLIENNNFFLTLNILVDNCPNLTKLSLIRNLVERNYSNKLGNFEYIQYKLNCFFREENFVQINELLINLKKDNYQLYKELVDIEFYKIIIAYLNLKYFKEYLEILNISYISKKFDLDLYISLLNVSANNYNKMSDLNEIYLKLSVENSDHFQLSLDFLNYNYHSNDTITFSEKLKKCINILNALRSEKLEKITFFLKVQLRVFYFMQMRAIIFY